LDSELLGYPMISGIVVSYPSIEAVNFVGLQGGFINNAETVHAIAAPAMSSLKQVFEL
jgi:hypothetical protein